MSVSDGIYTIYTALDDDVCMEVYWGSKLKGANVELWCNNDENNQHWQVTTTSGVTTIVNVNSGMFLEVCGSEDADGTNIQQWSDNGGTNNQKFTLVDSGLTTTRNGVSYPLYYIQSNLGTRVLDAQGGKANLGTNVELWTKHATAAGLNQVWCFVKSGKVANATTVTGASSFPTPAELGVAYTVGDPITRYARGDVTLYPSWICDGNAYQLRYRVRYRAATSDAVGDWGNWTSPSGTYTDDGWGNAWASNCAPVQTSARKWSPVGVNPGLTATGNDYAELQFETRKFSDNMHGRSAAVTVACLYLPTVTVSSVTYAPDGLRIVYTSDFAHPGNTIKVTSDLFKEHVYSAQPYTGTLLVPASDLSSIPADGDPITLSIDFRTKDGGNPVTKVSSTISYDAGYGETITPTVTIGDDKMATVVIGSHVSTKCWVKTGDNLTFVDESSTAGTYKTPIPFGVGYEIYCLAEDASKWDTWHQSYDAITCDYHLLNYDDGYLVVHVKKDDPPKQSGSISANTSSTLTNGLEYEHVTVGYGQKRSFSLDGSLVKGLTTGATFDNLDSIVGKKCWYRDPYGCIYRVVVTGVTFDRYHRYDDCSISMTRVDR